MYVDFRALLLQTIGWLQRMGEFPADLDLTRITVEPPRDPKHGDIATNAPLIIAGQMKADPMTIAEKLALALRAYGEALHILGCA